MRRSFRSWVPILFLGFLAGPPAFGEPAPLTWMVFDQAPQFIVRGPDKGQGAMDGALAYLQAQLGDYEHRVVVSNIQRALAELQTDGHNVVLGLVRTPDREKLFLFSEAFTVTFPPGLMVRRADLPALKPFQTAEGSLDLDSFLRAGRWTVGVAAGRSYGQATDTLLGRYQDRGVVYTRFAETGIMAGLTDMLSAGRVDSVLVYRSEVRYVIRDEARLGAFAVLPVLPAASPLTIHVAVPRTEWGRAFLEKLNPILLKARVDPNFRRIIDRWLDDETRALVAKMILDLR